VKHQYLDHHQPLDASKYKQTANPYTSDWRPVARRRGTNQDAEGRWTNKTPSRCVVAKSALECSIKILH
jgi:hypothetical protein